MNRKLRTVIACAALVGAVICGVLIWWVIRDSRREMFRAAIEEAWNRSDAGDLPEYLRYIETFSEFEVEKVETGDPVIITVTVRGIDLGGELKKMDPAGYFGATDEASMNDYLMDLVKIARPTEVTTIVYAWPQEDGYRIEFSETFVDAMSGMVWSYVMDLADELTGGGAK